jgi:hypothetical protein
MLPLFAACAAVVPLVAPAQEVVAVVALEEELVAVAGRITEVVCYESSALVTREVAVPAGAGLVEVVVGPLPPSLRGDSLYAEGGGDGVRVLSTRFRQRVERDATDDLVRQRQAEVDELSAELEAVKTRIEAISEDLTFINQLQQTAANGLDADADDGAFAAADFIEFTNFINGQRRELLLGRVEATREQQQLEQALGFANGQLQEAKAGGGDRVVREATVVIDRGEGVDEATVRLAYLVNAAGWRPQYRLRADGGAESAMLEHLAAINQRTGEDWTGVQLTLSTASPNLNAAPPTLEPVQVALIAGNAEEAVAARRERAVDNQMMLNLQLEAAQAQYGQQLRQGGFNRGGGFGGGGGGGGGGSFGDFDDGLNRVAAKFQENELLNENFGRTQPVLAEGQSVSIKLDGPVSVPWRDDEQLLEVAQQPMDPDVFYKAVPVLTPNVYRVAELANDGDDARVILPGPCGVYLGGDFVGRTNLPLVAIGREFTVGLGIDPQLSVSRKLVSRDSDVRGGNQVRRAEFELRIESFKDEPVAVRLWDRLPTGPDGDAAALSVELVENSTPLSDDADYLRDDRPAGLLRWDLTLAPDAPAEVEFAYTLAFDRALEIGGFQTRQEGV